MDASKPLKLCMGRQKAEFVWSQMLRHSFTAPIAPGSASKLRSHVAVGQNHGEHQRWQMDVHAPRNGAIGSATHGHVTRMAAPEGAKADPSTTYQAGLLSAGAHLKKTLNNHP